jgi:hypothetical protein
VSVGGGRAGQPRVPLADVNTRRALDRMAPAEPQMLRAERAGLRLSHSRGH